MRKTKSLKGYCYPVTVAILHQLDDMKGKIYDDSQIEASPDAVDKMIQENYLNGAELDGCPYSVDGNVLFFDDHPIIVNHELTGVSFVVGGLIENKHCNR